MNERSARTFVSLSRSQTQFFEQLSDEEFWRYATEAASPAPPFQCHANEYLICRLGIRQCMLPLGAIGEVISSPLQLTSLPAVPAWMSGLTTWRGEIIARIDLEAYLWNGVTQMDGITGSDYVPRTQAELLLIVQAQDITFGLMVTSVETMLRLDMMHIVPLELAPDWCSALCSEGIRGIVDDILVLDIPTLFDNIVRQIKE